ncbi:hypothetical protein ACP70R_041568 [Stipagrostis hirtigluma subsp. patula]
MENGIQIWSFNGKQLKKEEEMLRNLRKYSKKYEQEDQDALNQLSKQDRKKQMQHGLPSGSSRMRRREHTG